MWFGLEQALKCSRRLLDSLVKTLGRKDVNCIRSFSLENFHSSPENACCDVLCVLQMDIDVNEYVDTFQTSLIDMTYAWCRGA